MLFLLRLTVFSWLLPTILLLAGARVGQAAVAGPRTAFTLSGRIVGHKGQPLPGAVVTVKGTAALATLGRGFPALDRRG